MQAKDLQKLKQNWIANRSRQRQALQRELTKQLGENSRFTVPKNQQEFVVKKKFSSSWLPGPLSYPWMVLLASAPQVIREILNLS